MHVYTHVYAFLTCSVCIILHQLYMFSGLVIWYWLNNWCAAPWGRLFFYPQHYLVAYSFMCRKQLAVCLLSRVACLFLSLFCSCFDSHVAKTSCVELLTLLGDWFLEQTFWETQISISTCWINFWKNQLLYVPHSTLIKMLTSQAMK